MLRNPACMLAALLLLLRHAATCGCVRRCAGRERAKEEDFPATSWAELATVDPAYAKRAVAIAKRLGYCTQDAPG